MAEPYAGAAHTPDPAADPLVIAGGHAAFNPETIADFRKSERLDMDDRTESLIRSLKRSGSEYSEVFIRGPEVQALGRLVLDPYSATLFSSSPDTYAAIERRMVAGDTIEQALEAVAFPDAPQTSSTREAQHARA